MHRSHTIRVLWLLLSVLLVTGTSFASERPRLVVGGDHENPPFEFLEDGKATGFNVEIMRAVADAIGADVEFRLGPWAEVRKELEQGKIDALAGMYYSAERNKLVDFTIPHTMVSAGLFVRNDSPISSIDDIKGKEVIVQKGDVIDDYLHEQRITSRIIEVKDPADVLRLLASGSHDCALMPSRFQGEYLKQALGFSNIKAIATNLPQLRYCFAVKKGNSALRYRLDEALDVLKVNGRYKEIYEKWFGVYEKKSMWQTLRYFVWALALSALLLAASFVWSWALRWEVRKRTAELRAKDESLRFTQFAVDNTIDQAFWMTEEGRIFYVNDAACRALGYERQELLKLSIPDIDPIYQSEKFAEHWRDIQENGYATFETLHRSRDGRVYPVEIRANYVVFDGKEYNCAFATDISERKRAEEQLRNSEGRLRTLVQTLPDLVWLKDGNGVFLSCNSMFERLYGAPEAAIVGKTDYDFVDRELADFFKMNDRKAIAAGKPTVNEEWLTFLDDGHRALVETIKTPVYDDTGGLIGVLGIGRDITQRKQAEEELRESEEKFRVLAETSPAAIFLYQGDRYVYVSPSAIRLTGYSEQEFLQMNFWDFIHEDYRDLVKERGLARQQGKLVPSQYEIKIMAKNGEVKWLFVSGGSIEYKGRPAGIVTMFDITDRKRIEAELQHAYDELEKRVEERTAELRRAKELLEEEIHVRNRTEKVITARLRLLEIAATHSLDELMEAAINEAEALTGSSIGFFHFLEADQQTLSLQNWSTGTKAEFCRANGTGLHYDVSAAGVWADCIRERRPVIHNDYASLPHRNGMPPGHAGFFRELVLPVFRGDHIVAIIGVGNKLQDYTSEDVEAVSFLADLAWDITERKQAEEELRLSQFCIDKAGIGIYQSDETGAIFNVNEHACKSLGYSKEELCAISVFDIDPEITPEKMLELKKTIDEMGSMTHHTTHRRRDGTTFPVEITSNNLDFRGKSYGISFVKDITRRKRAEEALRESESRVRRKLESILDPEGDIGELELADIIDAPGIQALMDDLYRNTGLKMSIIDLKGKVLVDVGWQDICLIYHRGNPETLERCRESDTVMTDGVRRGWFRKYRCRNNMWHLVTPIFVGERHMGNLFMGQFFFENEELNYGLFRAQAREFGFPEEEYMAALEAVPRHSEEFVNNGKAFFLRLIDMFSKLSYGNIKLARLFAERDRLTATLRESEARLKLAMDLAKLGAWEYDVSTGMFSFDDQFYALYGTTAEQEGGTLMSAEVYARKFIPPEESAVVANGIEEVRANSYIQLEHRIIRADGYERFIVVRGEAVFDQEGNFVKIRGANQDVTERKLAEEEIRESRAKYQAIVDNFEGYIYICSQDYRVEFMNKKLIERTGYDATGEFCYKMMHDRDSVCPWCVNDRVFKGETLYWEMLSPKDNHWFYVVNVPIPHSDGTVSKQSMMLDITERKLAEEELRKANVVVENSPVVLFRCKAAPGWPVELVSKNVVQFGYTPEEFLSGEITYSSIVYPQDLPKVTAETEEYSAAGKGQWLQEYRIVTKGGEIRWIIDETVCARNEEGEITHYEGVIIDVTERRKAEEKLIVQQMQLKELNSTLEERVRVEVAKNREKDVMLIQQNRQAALGEVLDHIAHQWKQPLNAISLIIYLLKDNESLTIDEVNDTVDKILGQVDHMSQTISVFRDFYRPDKEKSVFFVKEGIDRAISFIMPALQYESIKVEVDADPKLTALGYPKEFAQVILNLVTNARDAFIEKKVDKPVLKIRGFAEGKNVVVTVTDNAGGIGEEAISKIFDMNFTTKELSGGTGIGLYMSRNIIERHMGGILTATNVSDGAQFIIRLATADPGGYIEA